MLTAVRKSRCDSKQATWAMTDKQTMIKITLLSGAMSALPDPEAPALSANIGVLGEPVAPC